MKTVKLNMKAALLLVGTGAVAIVSLSHCGGDSASSYRQIERFGRPAINEALVLSNANLNTFNSVGPTIDLTDAAAAVRTDVATVLGLIQTFSAANSLTAPSTAAVVAGFLPDVMRINTATASGYNADTATTSGGFAMLTGGRKITDDVADITICYLFMSDAAAGTACGTNGLKDNVSYLGTGAGTGLQGHDAALTTFPFLAAAN